MLTAKRDVLFVGFEPPLFERWTGGLSLADFRSDYISTAAGALELTALLPYDAVVIALPIPDMSTERLLDFLRRENSSCKHSAVVLIAPESHIGKGANRVLAASSPASVLQHVLPGIIGVAPRVPLRALARLEVPSEFGTTRVLCQTVNVSSSGMLLRIDETYAIGTEIGFELTVPGEPGPIRGQAEVVRHATQRRERLTGVALRFRSIQVEDQDRLVQHLSQLAV
jgi:PilZ domain